MDTPKLTGSGAGFKGSSRLAAALALAANKLRVLPLCYVQPDGSCSCGKECSQHGKHPDGRLTPHGSHDATTDLATIRRWWRECPNANLGIATGEPPRAAAAGTVAVLVVGPDGPKGIEALAELEKKHGPIPRTWRSKTGSDGKHHFFRWPAGCDIKNRRNHRGVPIDIRGSGGLAVVPPSRNANGEYEWEIAPSECELAEAPPWLIKWCQEEKPAQRSAPPKAPRKAATSTEEQARAYLATIPGAISGQGGHNQTMWAARCMALGFSLGAERAFSLLWQDYNPRCQPEWTEKELRHKAQEADAKPFDKPRGWLLRETKAVSGHGQKAHAAGAAAPERGGSDTQPAAPKPARPRLTPSPPYRPFPLDALPPVLRDYAGAAAAAMGCDPALVALPALAVVAGAIGNSRAIRLKRGWTEPPTVWSMTVAPSGRLKSPAWAKAVDPIMHLQLDILDIHGEKAKRRKDWEKLSKAEREEATEPPDPGPAPVFVTADATLEVVGKLLHDNQRGLLMACDELDTWFQGLTRYKKSGTDRAHWLQLHSARTLRVDRLSRPSINVRRACCSITGTIQPAVLARCLDREAVDAGLGARFLMAMPPARHRRWSEAEVLEELAGRYKELLLALLSKEPADKRKSVPHYLSLSPQAKAAWVPWFEGWADRQNASEDQQAAVLAKLEGYAARLALVHHVVSHAAADSDDLGHDVGDRSLTAAIQLTEWFAYEANRIYTNLHASEEEKAVRSLTEWIGARGGMVTVRQLQRSNQSRYPHPAEAEARLKELVESGLGRWEWRQPGPQGGKPTRVFCLDALVTSDNTSPDEDGADPPSSDTTSQNDRHNPKNTGEFRGIVTCHQQIEGKDPGTAGDPGAGGSVTSGGVMSPEGAPGGGDSPDGFATPFD